MSASHAGIGHNGASFDNVVQENLTRGLLLTIKVAMVTATRDPRCERRHLRVLAEIIDCVSTNTGMAWPGRKKLAQLTADALRPAGYSEATIAKTISELIAWGYLLSDKRAPEGGGRALSHYTIRKPSIADLQDEIAKWVQEQREANTRRPFPSTKEERALSVSASQNAHNPQEVGVSGVGVPLPLESPDGECPLTDERPLSVRADGECRVPADGEYRVPTVTSKRTNKTTSAAKDAALKTDASASRGSRLPADWALPEEWRAWTHSEFRVSAHQVQLQADTFRDYWHSTAGQKATKLDWEKTWANWCRRSFAKFHVPKTHQRAASLGDREREAYYAQLRAAESFDP
jgi:hypothetical protein